MILPLFFLKGGDRIMEEVLVLVTSVVNLLIAVTNLTVLLMDKGNKRRNKKENSTRHQR